MTSKTFTTISLCILTATFIIPFSRGLSREKMQAGKPRLSPELVSEARLTLKKGIRYFHSIAIHGGYVYNYTLDMKEKWGEGRTDDETIEVQPPGTPAVGMSFLRAYKIVKDPEFLQAAEDAADALIEGQNDLGGWGHKIYFNRPQSKRVSFDDNQTQSAIRFLMALDQEIQKPALSTAVKKALQMMLQSQLENGGWPHMYPAQGSYHDFATFNDNGINDCISVMIDAHRYYGKEEYLRSLKKVGWFMIISQLPPPQPGWAQQYNRYLQPAWARAFEPPSVCPSATLRNVNTLMDLFLYTNNGKYLEPIPDALDWLKASRLPNGKWGRFLELGTNKPLYYDRGRIRVNSMAELSLERRTGYGYETDLTSALQKTEKRFTEMQRVGRNEFLTKKNAKPSRKKVIKRLQYLTPYVERIIRSQDRQGRWVNKHERFKKSVPGYRWNGEYRVADRISSRVFNKNVEWLCDYLEMANKLQ